MLVIFGLLVAEYSYRTYTRRNKLTHSALALWDNKKFKIFCGAVSGAYLFILIRCAYRIPELLGGWGGELMRIELEFIILEGVMICLCVVCQTVWHPGVYFPVLASVPKPRHQKLKNLEDTELEPLSSYEDVRPAGRYYDPTPEGQRYESARPH